MDCSLPEFSVRGIIKARILEWVAISSFRGSSQPRDQTLSLSSPALVGRFFTTDIISQFIEDLYIYCTRLGAGGSQLVIASALCSG